MIPEYHSIVYSFQLILFLPQSLLNTIKETIENILASGIKGNSTKANHIEVLFERRSITCRPRQTQINPSARYDMDQRTMPIPLCAGGERLRTQQLPIIIPQVKREMIPDRLICSATKQQTQQVSITKATSFTASYSSCCCHLKQNVRANPKPSPTAILNTNSMTNLAVSSAKVPKCIPLQIYDPYSRTVLNSMIAVASLTMPSEKRMELSLGKISALTIPRTATESVAHNTHANNISSLCENRWNKCQLTKLQTLNKKIKHKIVPSKPSTEMMLRFQQKRDLRREKPLAKIMGGRIRSKNTRELNFQCYEQMSLSSMETNAPMSIAIADQWKRVIECTLIALDPTMQSMSVRMMKKISNSKLSISFKHNLLYLYHMEYLGNLQIHVTEFKQSPLDSSIIFYTLQIVYRTSRWTLQKRYSEFDQLQKALKKIFHTIPTLPGKSLFKLKEASQLEERRKGLEEFTRQLVQRKDIISSQHFRSFVQLDTHAHDIVMNPPALQGQFEIDPLEKATIGVRAFQIDLETMTFFMVNSDMSTVSRLNSVITNTKKPWSKQQDLTSFSVVGTLQCYTGKPWAYKKLWRKGYPVQAICLDWCRPSQMLTVGLDDGTVDLVRCSIDKDFVAYETIITNKIHAGRVMGVKMDPFMNCILSVSEDCQFKISEDVHLVKLWSMAFKNSLTGLQYDQVNKRAFISSSKGQFFIYSINDKKNPVLLNNTMTTSKGCIRGMAFDSNNHYVFTGGHDDGEICAFFVEKPGREKYSALNATFKGKDKVRTVAWSSSRQQIMVGSANGTITFWNPIKAESIQITQVTCIEKESIMITACKSREVNIWKLPTEWRSKDLEAQEQKDIDQQRKVLGQNKVKIAVEKKEEDSDEDDLAGWHRD